MGTLRSKKMWGKYKKQMKKGLYTEGCALCKEKVMKKFKYWKIIDNRFPWDRIAITHHMIVPIRHVTEEKLNKSEIKEYAKIKKDYINSRYELIGEATKKKKSIPDHFHIHLIVAKD